MSKIEVAAGNNIVATTPEDLKNKLKNAFERFLNEKTVGYLSFKQGYEDTIIRVDATQRPMQCWHYNLVERSASPFIKNIVKEQLPAGTQFDDHFHDFYELIKEDIIRDQISNRERERITPDKAIKDLEHAIATNAWEQRKQKKSGEAALKQAIAQTILPKPAAKGWAPFRLFKAKEEMTSKPEAKEQAKATSAPPKVK